MAEPTQAALVAVDLRADGVLWMMNKAVFHPRGFALALDVDSGALTLLGDGSEPWTYDHSIEPEPFAAFFALLDRAQAKVSTPEPCPCGQLHCGHHAEEGASDV